MWRPRSWALPWHFPARTPRRSGRRPRWPWRCCIAGSRFWPVILAGAFTINFLFMLRAGIAPTLAVPVSVGVGIRNMLEAWLGVRVLRRIAGDQFPFDGL